MYIYRAKSQQMCKTWRIISDNLAHVWADNDSQSNDGAVLPATTTKRIQNTNSFKLNARQTMFIIWTMLCIDFRLNPDTHKNTTQKRYRILQYFERMTKGAAHKLTIERKIENGHYDFWVVCWLCCFPFPDITEISSCILHEATSKAIRQPIEVEYAFLIVHYAPNLAK